MKSSLLLILSILIFSSCGNANKTSDNASAEIKTTTESASMTNKSIYDFKIEALDGKGSIDLADFRGKKLLLVNVASKCGFTYQYEDLQKLYELHGDKLAIVGFPCNQFGGQEPGTEEEIANFCSENYGVSFPISSKIDVKGTDQHEIYSWLCNEDQNGFGDFSIKWNFYKFLIDEQGNLIGHFDSRVKPMDPEILDKI